MTDPTLPPTPTPEMIEAMRLAAKRELYVVDYGVYGHEVDGIDGAIDAVYAALREHLKGTPD